MVISLRINLLRFHETKRKILKLKKKNPEILKDIIDDVSRRVVISAKLRAPFYTGRLRESIRRQWVSPFILEIVAGEGVPYAIFQELGYRAHWIHRSMWMGPKRFKRPFIFIKGKAKEQAGFL